MIRGYVDEKIWLVLAKLSFFFRQLCAKELDKVVVAKLEEQAAELIVDLEAIFPPGFFNPMQHLLLHLPEEARLGGPCAVPLDVFNRERAKETSREKHQQMSHRSIHM